MRRVEWVEGEPVVRDVPEPVPGPGEVLVEVARAGVTLPVVRAGAGDAPPGGDVVGRVVSSASGSSSSGTPTTLPPGTRVAGLCASGAYAERAVVAEAFAAPVPDGICDDDAVALVRGGQVALGALRAGDPPYGSAPARSVLVTAAAGGVGHLAVQLARLLGAERVVAGVGPGGPPERVTALCGLGVDDVVAYPDLPGVEPVDLVLDGAGGDALPHALSTLATRGRLVAYNGVGGPVDTNDLRRLGQSVIGFAMPHMVARDPDSYTAHRELLWRETAAGRVRPLVHGPFGLDDAGAAHALLAGRRNVGRVVLAP